MSNFFFTSYTHIASGLKVRSCFHLLILYCTAIYSAAIQKQTVFKSCPEERSASCKMIFSYSTQNSSLESFFPVTFSPLWFRHLNLLIKIEFRWITKGVINIQQTHVTPMKIIFLMIFHFQTSLVKNSIIFGNFIDTSAGGGAIEKPL